MIRSYTSAALLSAALLVGLSIAAVGPTYVNHDAAWYLHMAGVWLDGGVLYRDVIDTNPPLIVFLTAVPVWIARLVHVPETLVFKLFVFVAALSITACSVPLIRRVWESPLSHLLVGTAVVFATLPFVQSEFGQREHLTVLMVVPYLLAACCYVNGRPPSRRAEVLAGGLAGLGFAMKPHFLVAWLAVELSVLALRSGSRSLIRPAVPAAVASLLVYVLIVVVFVPAYLPVVRETMQVYGALDASMTVLLGAPELRVAIVAVGLMAVLRFGWAQRAASVPLVAAAIGFLLAALIQRKGWGYHFLPFRAVVLVYFAALLAALTESHPAIVDVIRGGARMLATIVILVASIWSARSVSQTWRTSAASHVALLVPVVEQSRADSLALLAMRRHVYPAFPVVNYTGSRWVLRHNALWFLPGLYRDDINRGRGELPFRRPEEMPPLERQYYEQIVDDLCARPPQLLIVEPPIPDAPAGHRSLDLVAYYRQDARFDRLFGAYRSTANVGGYAVYSGADRPSCAEVEGRR